MKKYLAAAGVAVGLLGGSLAVGSVNPLSLAGAQDTPSTTVPVEPEGAPTPDADRRSPLDAALRELVADGTLTQDQADAVAARADAKRAERGDGPRGAPGERGGPGGERRERGGPGGDPGGDHRGRGGLFGAIGGVVDSVASQLGMTPDDVHEALRSGTSLRDLAVERGVDPAAISQVLVDAANARIDAALADGTITEEQADSAKAKVSDAIGGVMDASSEGPGRGGNGPRGPRGHVQP